MDVGLLDDGRQGFLRHAARLEEAWEVAALPPFWDMQFDRAGPGLPAALSRSHDARASLPQQGIAVALVGPVRAAHAGGRTREGFHLHVHQPLGSEADHLAQKIGVSGLLQQVLEVDLSP